MSISDEELELLIGKLVDGEISPDEKARLDEELICNDRARVLLEQTQLLSAACRKHLPSRLRLWPGEAEETFHRAWQRQDWNLGAWFIRLRDAGHLRFAAGLAAGFLLGLILHLTLVRSGATSEAPPLLTPPPNVVAHGGQNSPDEVMVPVAQDPVPVVRNVDWYTFTDDAGNQYLVEGVREGMIQPAVYYGQVW